MQINNLRWRLKTRKLVPVEEVKRILGEAAVRRWQECPELVAKRQAAAERKEKAAQLRADKKLLASVMRDIRQALRGPLEKERKRIEALVWYHEHRDAVNKSRGKGLDHWFRRALARAEKVAVVERRRLFAAIARVEKILRNRVNRQLKRALRRRFQQLFKSGVKFSKTAQDLVGCEIPALRAHLEKLWKPGMNWENYGYRGWHIDHITPCARFDLSSLEQREKCFHYTNLQPLWAKENFDKRDH